MNIRTQIQRRLTDRCLELQDLLLYVSIRLGKTKIALDAIEPEDKVLWLYPSNAMMSGYQEDINKFPPASSDITFSNISSVKKYKDTTWDMIVVDEPQRCQSAAQLKVLATLKYKKRIGLSGTMNKKTVNTLKEILNWDIGAQYTLEDGIRDGIVKDYKIFIHLVDMCNEVLNIEFKKYGKPVLGTEREAYDSYTATMDYFSAKQAEALVYGNRQEAMAAKFGFTKYMGLRTNLLYNSQCLLTAAETLIHHHRHDKVLIYTLRTEVADKLSPNSYHTKKHDDTTLEWFRGSTDGHLAVIDCVTTGITIKNLNTVIFHSYDSNTENFHQKLGRSLLHETPGETSHVLACALKDTQNMVWIEKACSSLHIDKIFYVVDGEVISKLDYIIAQNPDKDLYLVKDSQTVVYYAGENENGFPTYSFLGSPLKQYSFSQSKLQALCQQNQN